MSEYLVIDHPRFCRVDRDIFVKQVAPDCMGFDCRLIRRNRRKPDACCSYGVDVDLHERDAILAHADEIRSLLRAEVRDVPWFEDELTPDPDFPSGTCARTNVWNRGCIFLAHDQRGCAIHRAALAGGWDFVGVKPHVCRLFPLSYEHDAIVISDDYPLYTCGRVRRAPTLYQVGRSDLASIFGRDLVALLDRAEGGVASERIAVAS